MDGDAASAPPPPASSPAAALTGWERVARLFSYAFARHDAEDEVPPMPEEFKEWAQDTLLATFAGMLFGGGQRWAEERSAGTPQPPPEAPTKLHAARAIAEANTRRLSRVSDACVRSGLRFGGLAATFFAVQTLSSTYRGRRDFLDAAHGGLAAGAVFGLSLHRSVGSPTHPARALVLGAALGASLGIPMGLLQDRLLAALPEEHRAARQRRQQQLEEVIRGAATPARLKAAEAAAASRQYDVAAAIIQQLEASLSSSPTQQAQQQQQQQAQQERQQERQQQQQDDERLADRRWWHWR